MSQSLPKNYLDTYHQKELELRGTKIVTGIQDPILVISALKLSWEIKCDHESKWVSVKQNLKFKNTSLLEAMEKNGCGITRFHERVHKTAMSDTRSTF